MNIKLVYTHIHTSALCTEVRTTVYGRGRGLRGPVGVGWCACDMSNIINPHLAGLGVVGREWFGHYQTCGEEGEGSQPRAYLKQ